MVKFKKNDKVAVIMSWDNKGTVRIRRAVVHSAGNVVMRLQDEAGAMFKVAFKPEANVMSRFNGIHIVADDTNEALEAIATADAIAVINLNRSYGEDRIAKGDDFNIRVGNEHIAELHETRIIWA